ncbi:MAG: hypothetical protein ABJC39_06665 [Chloroflexota bacterium]
MRRWPRAVILGLSVTALVGVLVSPVSATSIPSGFFTVTDQQGANDVPGQVDLTQMGRDDSDASVYKLFWSWDSTDQWTGTGQTGDACALFDSDGDGKINFVVCGQINNPNADPAKVLQTPSSPFLFSCSDAKIDRCTQPTGPLSYTSAEVQAGLLGTPTNRTTNLITDTDPFATGTSNPNDSTLQVNILKSRLPAGSVLVNVCSYPSAGNGGNNNPFDCIVTPGGGFLIIQKDAGSDSTTNFGFTVAPAPAAPQPSTYSVTGTGQTAAIGMTITSAGSVTEAAVTNWSITAIACKLQDGTTATGTPSIANRQITGVTIQSGKVTTCKFTNAPVLPKLTVTKVVTTNNGGTAVVADFPLFVGSTGVTSGVKNTFTAGTYTVIETGKAGYTGVISGDCAANGSITLALGDDKSCTITNDDDAPALHLRKVVTNDNGGGALTTAWTLTATGTVAVPTNLSGSTPVDSGTGFKADTYTLAESGGPASGYTASTWSCVLTGTQTAVAVTNGAVTVGLGKDVTCTITNDDTKASPAGTTVQRWVLKDALTLTGLRSGATNAAAATVTFRLYSDVGCSTQVGSDESVAISGGVATTATGVTVTDTGTFRWRAEYSGDDFNNGFTTACGAEVTQIFAKDAKDGGRDNLVVIP